jgi:hypothetical protein
MIKISSDIFKVISNQAKRLSFINYQEFAKDAKPAKDAKKGGK